MESLFATTTPGQGYAEESGSVLGLECTSTSSCSSASASASTSTSISTCTGSCTSSTCACASVAPKNPETRVESESECSSSSSSLSSSSLVPEDDSDSSIAVLSPPPPPSLLPLRLPSTNNSPANFTLDRKDAFFSLGSVSPPKQQSPLRQSVSSIDCPDELSLDGQAHKTRFTTRPSKLRHEKPPVDKASERLLDRIRTSDLFPQSSSSTSSSSSSSSSSKSSAAHNRRRSLFSPIEFKRSASSVSTVETDGWTTPSSSFPSPMRSTPFSFITSKMAGLKSFGSTPVSVPSTDELINLDIETALFPQGTPHQGDSFTPAALMNLQITANGLLKKFQGAYQQQAILIQELKAEKEAQDDEKAEADVRTRHLKMQLEGMARKLSESQAAVQSLTEDLNKEKQLRIEERKTMAQSEGSISEDLCVEEDQQRKRTWRRSGETSKSDFSFETDEDSLEEASLFSRSRSPTLAPSIISEIGASEPPAPLTLTKQAMPPPLPPQHEPQQQQPQPQPQPKPQPQIAARPVRTSQMSAFQKLFKGISDSTGCRNCQGQDASVAWDTVGLLRVENKGLKQRVGELEAVVEEALDVVNGIGRESDELAGHY